LIANELVSIQPMSLPSGLLFYLDYTYGSHIEGAEAASSMYTAGQSIYNSPVGKGIQSGSIGVGGQYDLLGSGYSRRQERNEDAGSAGHTAGGNANAEPVLITLTDAGVVAAAADGAQTAGSHFYKTLSGSVGRLVDFDPAIADALDSGVVEGLGFLLVPCETVTGSSGRRTQIGGATAVSTNLFIPSSGGTSMSGDLTMLQDFAVSGGATPITWALPVPSSLQAGTGIMNFRRHTKRVTLDSNSKFTVDPLGGSHVLFVLAMDVSVSVESSNDIDLSFPVGGNLDVGANGDALTVPTFESNLGGSNANTVGDPIIPEIDIKIESLAVTAVSRKLKAKWSPELAQDLNAYHSLDAEVELTQILSEQIALELDREVLNDLLTQANGATLFWSRAPGKFVNKLNGSEIARNSSLRPGPQFTGTVRDWYETLSETIIDAANIIHRKTLRGSANFIVIGPDVATILESSVMYKPSYSIDGQGQASAMSIGAEKIGSLSNRFTVYKDPYFPRNKILVGYKGGSYLETGYVYAPYVPLIVTPTIFAPEDFTPRKGVMTRYGKKMVRSDFYGTVTCLDMNII
jgi:hypothetical protein